MQNERATDKQIGMLVYVVRNEYPEAIPSHKDERGEEMKYNDLDMFARTKLDKYQVSSLINVVSDPDFDETWRQDFLIDYLKAKGFELV